MWISVYKEMYDYVLTFMFYNGAMYKGLIGLEGARGIWKIQAPFPLEAWVEFCRLLLFYFYGFFL